MKSSAFILLGLGTLIPLVLTVNPPQTAEIFSRFHEFPDPIFNPGREMEIDVDSPAIRFRLPNQVVPRHYKLEIRPLINEGEVDRFTAPGVVQITVECLQATKDVVLHSSDLTINTTSVKVWPTENPTALLPIQGTSFQLINETFTITVQDVLAVGIKYDIYIEYVARIPDPSERMNGIYRSSYVADSGETRYLATTQFSRTLSFRKTLPSFDEPNQKASFEISVGRQANHHTLSNMNLRVSEPITGKPGWTWDRYNPTPVMPATVIAFIVSDFASETAPAELFHPDKPVKVWGPPPALKNGAAVYAVETGAKILKHLEEYFEIEYELPKMDLAAIPDFAAGAMENWGLNTYRVIYLTWLNGVNTVAEKFRCSSILGHELAHQYWGNLVTHEWWNDWWLTEGFASYFEYTTVQNIQPEFQAVNRLVTSDTQPAMEFDVGPTSVPVHGNTTSEFVENPSVINYSKGAALVQMMQTFLGEEAFRKSVIYYLKKRSYTAVHQDALFNDIMEYLVSTNSSSLPSNNKTIKEIMDTWTLQSGVPLVQIYYAGPNTLYASQMEFQNLDARNSKQENAKLWNIPVAYASASNPSFEGTNIQPKFWINDDVLVTAHAVDTNQWIAVNPDGRSYYRVLYDNHFGTLLQNQLQNNISSIAVGSRSMLVDDYFTFAYQKYINIEQALEMTKFIANETDFNAFVPFLKHLRKAYELFSSNQTEFDAFKTYMNGNLRNGIEKTGWTQIPGEDPLLTLTRVQLLDWTCPMGDFECRLQATTLVSSWQTNPSVNPVPVDLRPIFYCTAASVSDIWLFLLNQYDLTKNPVVRNALACSETPATLQSVLDKALDNTTVPVVDVVPLIQRVAMNSEGRLLVVALIEDKFTDIYNLVGSSGVADILNTLSTYTKLTTEIQRIQDQVTKYGVELANEMDRINSYLDQMALNQVWMSEFGNPLQNWLAKPF